MTGGGAYALMDCVPGKTMNELAYRNPDVLEQNRVRIAFQLGMHAAFSYVFGVKDGYQSNYLFDESTKTLTRVDNERFLQVPENPDETLSPGDAYTREIAACEMENLKYIPSCRSGGDLDNVLKAFNTGFLEKYREMKERKARMVELIRQARGDAYAVTPGADEGGYRSETDRIAAAVSCLVDQNPVDVLKRLYAARAECRKK